MSLPAIRYPLPSLALAALLTALVWQGSAWIGRIWRKAIVEARREVLGQEYPASDRPMAVNEVLPKKVLLLRAPLEAMKKPGGAIAETIHRRSIAHVYDVWPQTGPPTHYRIGTFERAIGWVGADVVLPWDLRLVVRPLEKSLSMRDSPTSPPQQVALAIAEVPLPIIAWNAEAVEVAIWERDRPWVKVERRGWLKIESISPQGWGVLLTGDELSDALRRTRSRDQSADRAQGRTLALRLGLADQRSFPQSRDRRDRSRRLAAVCLRRRDARRRRSAFLARSNQRTSRPRCVLGFDALLVRPSQRVALRTSAPLCDSRI